MREGRLKAIVATSSLELGIDIGELDEEFVWERKPNDRFIIGAQRWRIVGIDSQKVEILPARLSGYQTSWLDAISSPRNQSEWTT